MRFFFFPQWGVFWEDISIWRVLPHTKSTWSVQGVTQTLCFERGRPEESQGQPSKTGIAASIAAEGHQTGWQLHVLGQGFPPCPPALVPPNHSPPQWQWQQPAPLSRQSKQQGYSQFVTLYRFRPLLALPVHRAKKEKKHPPEINTGAAAYLKHLQINEMGILADTWENRQGLLQVRLRVHAPSLC